MAFQTPAFKPKGRLPSGPSTSCKEKQVSDIDIPSLFLELEAFLGTKISRDLA